ncbi:hypothetical protein MesoLj131a_28960 [Mesorhizobium sp. 131-2-1]|nr:hypothetical protein MesoLj131a_28960 [Mesorhizobium sp. 131-2-1]
MFQDVMVPDAQDRITLSAHEVVTAAVICAAGVLVAVDFNDKPILAASEVGKKRADGKLARKAITAKLARLLFKPKQCFRLVA